MATKKQLKQELKELQKRLAHIEHISSENAEAPQTYAVPIRLDLVLYVDRTTTPIEEIIEQIKDFSNWDLETVYRRHQPACGEYLYISNISVKEQL